MLDSSYWSNKASTSKCKSMYMTSTFGSMDLNTGISNLTGARCFFSFLPLLCLLMPGISLAVKWPSESTPLSQGRMGVNTCLPRSVLGPWEADLTALLGWDRWPLVFHQPFLQTLSWWWVGEHLPQVAQRSLTRWMPKQGSMGPGPQSVPYTCGTLWLSQHGTRPL